jgi:hypothetical protein
MLKKGFVSIGQKEPLLSHLSNAYRYLVEDNYKIIYHHADRLIVIDMVFDTRQNPEKITARI